MKISIVIPALNEAERIAGQVEACLGLDPQPEVIVADGESSDGTVSKALRAGARVVSCIRRGRAAQMNEAARITQGDVLIFLHADVRIAQRAYEALMRSMQDPDLLGGAFRRRFEPGSFLLDLGCRLAEYRGKWLRIYLGDQAIFVRREAFRKIGGFPEILLFEDVEISRRLARIGKTRLLKESVVASGRRFDRDGNLRGLSRNLWLTGRYLLGADPDRLARHYYPGCYPMDSNRTERGREETV